MRNYRVAIISILVLLLGVAGSFAQTPVKALPNITSYFAGGGVNTAYASATYANPVACTKFPAYSAIDALGDGCLAIDVALTAPLGVLFDSLGNAYIGETTDVRKVDANTGVISLFAGGMTGNLASGSPCDSTNAPGAGLTPDPTFVSMANQNILGGDGCPAVNPTTQAPYSYLKGIRQIAIDGNYLYITDSSSSRVRMVGLSNSPMPYHAYAHEIESLAKGSTYVDGTTSLTATIHNNYSIAVDSNGVVYLGDQSGAVVRRIMPTTFSGSAAPYTPNYGMVNTIAGCSVGTASTQTCTTAITGTTCMAFAAGGTDAFSAGLGGNSSILAMVVDTSNNLIIAASKCNSVMKISNPAGPSPTASYLMGSGIAGGYSGGTWMLPSVQNTNGVTNTATSLKGLASGLNGIVYIATYGNSLWEYDPHDLGNGSTTGWLHQFWAASGAGGCAGNTDPYFVGCPVAGVRATGMNNGGVDPYGNLYIAETGNAAIIKAATGLDFMGYGPPVKGSVARNSAVWVQGSNLSTASFSVLSGPFSLGTPSCAQWTNSSGVTNNAYYCNLPDTFTPTQNAYETGTLAVNGSNLAMDGLGAGFVTITCSSGAKEYGAPDPAFTFTSSPTIDHWTVAPVCGAVAESGPGSYQVVVTNLASVAANGYSSISVVPGTLSVSVKLITPAVTVNAGGVYPATFSGFFCALNGVVGSDDAGCVATGSATELHVGHNLLNYTVALTGAAAGNYQLSSTAGSIDHYVAPAPVTAILTASNKTYDGTTSATVACGLSGIASADAGNVGCTATGTFSGAAAGTGVAVNATIVLTGAAAGNYALTAANGTTAADILPAPLTITAANVEYVYGQTPVPACTVTGAVNGEVLTCTAAVVGSATLPTANASAALANYTVTPVNGTATMDKAPLTITAGNIEYIYGATVPTPACTVTGAVNGDVLTCTAAVVGGATVPTANAAAALAFYTVTPVNGTVTVDKAALTITAGNIEYVYGATVPTPACTVTGAVNGDVLTCTAAVVGSATVPTANAAAALANYTVTPVNGTVTVDKAALTITAGNIEYVYGATVPTPVCTVTGAANGEVYACTASIAGASTVPAITAAPGLSNYTVTAVDGSVTMHPAVLTCTSPNVSYPYGQGIPAPPACGCTGAVNGEQFACIASYSGTAITPNPSPVPISAHYTVVRTAGTLMMTPVPLTAIADDKRYAWGTPAPLPTCRVVGAVLSDAFTCKARIVGDQIIPYEIDPAPAPADYAVTVVNGHYTVPTQPDLYCNQLSNMTYGDGTVTITCTANPVQKITFKVESVSTGKVGQWVSTTDAVSGIATDVLTIKQVGYIQVTASVPGIGKTRLHAATASVYFTAQPKPLIINVQPVVLQYGQPQPPFSIKLDDSTPSMAPGEGPLPKMLYSVLDGTGAKLTRDSNLGVYTIHATTTLPNYDVKINLATLTYKAVDNIVTHPLDGSTLTFKDTLAGNTQASVYFVKLVNKTGAESLTFTPAINGPDFTVSPTVPDSVNPNACTATRSGICYFKVTFAPQTAHLGPLTETLAFTVRDNNSAEPGAGDISSGLSYTLEGNSLGTFSVSTPVFDATKNGSTNVQTVVLSNNSDFPLTVSGISSTNPGHFAVTTLVDTNNTCLFGAPVIPAGGTCSFPVIFKPTAGGTATSPAYSGTLIVKAKATATKVDALPTVLVSLSANSVGWVSYSVSNAAPLAVQSTVKGVIKVTNQSDTLPVVTAVVDNTANFKVTNGCPASGLQARQACSISVALIAPQAGITYTGTLTITDPITGTTNYTLSGTK